MIEAYVLATVETGREYEVAESLVKHPNVREVAVLYGIYDLLIHVEAEQLPQLDQIITEIRSDKRIRQTTTLIAANILEG